MNEQVKIIENITSMSFEEALSALENIVKKLESGQESLETAITNYEIGNALKEHCAKKLREAELRVDKIVQKMDGSVAIEPFEQKSLS